MFITEKYGGYYDDYATKKKEVERFGKTPDSPLRVKSRSNVLSSPFKSFRDNASRINDSPICDSPIS